MIRRTILLALFDLLYTRFARSYDLVSWLASAGLWYRWTEEALSFVQAGPVLEVGCGRGRLLRALARDGHGVTGVDRSLQMAHYARKHSRQPVARADGRALPFRDGHFATLITTFPAPYVFEPWTQVEFARVVQPSGVWVWVDMPTFHLHAHTLLARVLTRFAWGKKPGAGLPALAADRSGGLWQIELRRIHVGPSTVVVRVAQRTSQG
ncbi:MAG: class I SAM-dependent methyltransferase [Ardenticatenaceae bacterium]